MDPALIIQAVLGGIQVVQTLAPEIQALIQKGALTDAQQQQILTALASINFTGPEWQVSGRTS